jgi:hypothetical protein|tara:strand:+ start:2922 stop:3296 length:375 start_codon:yes stop_codon:yes gene_type:complete
MKVRFHLGAGEHHRKFQVIDDDGVKSYHDPEKVQLRMINCKLHNRPKTASLIYESKINKTVCSWIRCEKVEVLSSGSHQGKTLVEYNPRKKPHWVIEGKNVDYQEFDCLVSDGRNVFIGESTTV